MMVTTNGNAPPVEAVEHRRAFRAYVLNEAEPWHREHLARLYALWDEWNERFYRGALEPPYLLLNEPSNPRRLGDCALWSGFGGRSQIRIRPSLLTGTHPHWARTPATDEERFAFAADVLLHEQIHQFHQEITGRRDEGYHGHGPAFAETANRIGAELGLPRVRTCKRRGPDRELPSCAQWPHCVRPGGQDATERDPETQPQGVTARGDNGRPSRGPKNEVPSRLASPGVVLNGDPDEAAFRLLDALLELDLVDQLVIYNHLAEYYGGDELEITAP